MNNPHDSMSKTRFVRHVLVLTLIVVAFVFSVYEVLERTWLSDMSLELLYVLHLLRGIGTSVAVGLIIGWYIITASPSMFPSGAMDDSDVYTGKRMDEARLVHFSRWFVLMRWLAVTVAFVLAVVSIQVLHYLEESAFWPLVCCIIILAVTNLFYLLCLHNRWLVERLAVLQIIVDLILLTAMLHFSGGIENPMLFAYIFHIIIAGVLLERAKCYAIALVASGLFALMALAEMSELLKHYTLLVFPHGGDEHGLVHASHDLVYVLSLVSLQSMFLFLTAFFIVTIMEQLRSEKRQAHAVQQRLERVVQATGAGFAVFDKTLQPVWLNDQLKTWLNISENTLERDAIIEQWTQGADGPAAHTFADGKVRSVERNRGDAVGNKRHYQVTVAPLKDRVGDVYQVVELSQDITERKMLETQMIHSSKMASLGVMAAGIAHEVGNPLASMTVRLKMLERQHDEASIKESVQVLQRQIGRISHIVRGVTQFARPAKKEWSLCDVNVLAKEALNVLSFHSQTKTCQIVTEMADALPCVMCSKDQLTQVFLNLGLNALEAMEQGGSLTITTYAESGDVCISFADMGPGISEESLENIFDPFFSSKENGLGLGLSIVHNLVDAHGGRISAENVAGGGALFTVVLPGRRAMPQT